MVKHRLEKLKAHHTLNSQRLTISNIKFRYSLKKEKEKKILYYNNKFYLCFLNFLTFFYRIQLLCFDVNFFSQSNLQALTNLVEQKSNTKLHKFKNYRGVAEVFDELITTNFLKVRYSIEFFFLNTFTLIFVRQFLYANFCTLIFIEYFFL